MNDLALKSGLLWSLAYSNTSSETFQKQDIQGAWTSSHSIDWYRNPNPSARLPLHRPSTNNWKPSILRKFDIDIDIDKFLIIMNFWIDRNLSMPMAIANRDREGYTKPGFVKIDSAATAFRCPQSNPNLLFCQVPSIYADIHKKTRVTNERWRVCKELQWQQYTNIYFTTLQAWRRVWFIGILFLYEIWWEKVWKIDDDWQQEDLGDAHC